MTHHLYRTLIRPRPRTVEDRDPAFAHAACSEWHGILALYGDYDPLEALAGMWLIPASSDRTMQSMLAQIARTLRDFGWVVDAAGLWSWWLSKTEHAAVVARYETILGDDSGEGEYV